MGMRWEAKRKRERNGSESGGPGSQAGVNFVRFMYVFVQCTVLQSLCICMVIEATYLCRLLT